MSTIKNFRESVRRMFSSLESSLDDSLKYVEELEEDVNKLIASAEDGITEKTETVTKSDGTVVTTVVTRTVTKRTINDKSK